MTEQPNKPLYTSRKFQIALATFAYVLIVTFVPAVFGIDGEGIELLQDKLDFAFYFGLALMGGHSIMDALSMAVGRQSPALQDAADELKETIPHG
jgi:hypothetical protein